MPKCQICDVKYKKSEMHWSDRCVNRLRWRCKYCFDKYPPEIAFYTYANICELSEYLPDDVYCFVGSYVGKKTYTMEVPDIFIHGLFY